MALFLWIKPLTILFFVCSTPHYTLLDKGFKSIENSLGKPSYTPTTPTMEKSLDNHMYGLYSLEFQQKDERLDPPSRCSYLNCMCPYKQRYIAGSAKCSSKSLCQIIDIYSAVHACI